MLSITHYTNLVLIVLMATCLNAHAGDLDDDIELDEKIEKYDTLDQPGLNIEYIKRSAKASVAGDRDAAAKSGDTAVGGFINQPGAEAGDVTIIFNGEDINVVSE